MYKKRIDVNKNSSIFIDKSNKKAQVTVFIILGIVMLLAVALVILLQTEVVKFKTEEIIPTDKGKVENFISTCIEQIGDEALLRIGLQGGYIDVPQEIAHDGTQHLRLSPNLVVPYWAYGNNVHIPSLDDIKIRIDNYMKQNLHQCLFNLAPFQEVYNLVEKSSIQPDTQITDAKVIFNVKWDIEVKNKAGEKVAEVIDHQAESPIKLKQLHDAASLIINQEMSSLKVEDITQDLLALEHPDVPTAGMQLSCTKKTWEVQKVESSLKQLLHINIPQLQIKGTDIINYPENLPYYQNHYLWDLGPNYENKNINVYFNYQENYPFTFAVTPLAGTKMQSSMLGGTEQIPFLCIQSWKFTYDLSYPILMRLRDETTGYNFNTAFTVHIIRNTPNRNDIVARAYSNVETVTSEKYCANSNVPMSVKTFEIVENDLGVSNREEISNVNLSYTCIRYKCDLGQTSFDPYTASSKLTTNFPYCVGGILRGTKQDYKESWLRVVTEPNKQVELNIVPLSNFAASKIKVVKHEYQDAKHVALAQPLGDKETVLIKLILVKPNTTEPFHESTLAYSTNDKELQDLQHLQFLAKADFTYNLEINIFNEDKIIGGYKGPWTVSWSQISQANEIIFHTVSKASASEEEMYPLILALPQISTNVPQPEIK